MNGGKEPEELQDVGKTLLEHLTELRDRLLRVVLAVVVAIVVLLPFSNTIYLYIAAPLMARMPAGSNMVAVGVASPFMAPFKLTMLAAVALVIPYILYQLWGFIAPGLYQNERRLVVPLLVSSTVLFYVGMAFAYYVVFPIVFSFFLATAPQGIAVMTDIGQYLDFVLALFLAFGIAFEVPIATILLVWMGIITPEALIGQRSYVIVGTFVIGMFLTPPDAFSQTLLAIPMWLLFEAGVFFSYYFVPETKSQKQAQDIANHATNPISSTAKTVDTKLFPAPVQGGTNDDRYQPLTDAELEAELDAADFEETLLREGHLGAADGNQEAGVEAKLLRVKELRQKK